MRPRFTPAHPWQPLSDAEYATLGAFLPPTEGPGRRGRRPADRRRTLDAIFWVACSQGPWKELPAELGRPDSAHRQLRRWARAGVLDRLLFAAAGAGPRGGDRRRRPRSPAERLLRAGLAALEYRLRRAWRRMARLASVASLLLAKRLGLWTALPCAPWFLPNPDLSETLQRLVEALFARLERNLHALPPGLLALCGKALAFAGGQPRRFRLA
jgi:transposase